MTPATTQTKTTKGAAAPFTHAQIDAVYAQRQQQAAALTAQQRAAEINAAFDAG